MQSLVTSLVLSRLDLFNCVLVGLPASGIRRLQTVQNAAARLVFNIRRSDHVTDALFCLHWLRVAKRIRFKMAVMAFRSIHGLPPSYPYQAGRPGLRSASSQRLIVPRTRIPRSVIDLFWLLVLRYGTTYRLHVTSAPSLSIFRNRLKTYLFNFSYPGIVI